MDTSDPEIVFSADGTCNHCANAQKRLAGKPYSLPAAEKEKRLADLVARIKAEGKGKRYDCIIGVSGGVDSTYVAYLVGKLGLRPLAVHLDNGWDSKLAVTNVENVLKKTGIDLFTHVIDWQEFKDLQLSFLKASTPDSEIPSDHAIFAIIYHLAAKHGIKNILFGTNLSSESILPKAWSQGHSDWKYIRSVHKAFGTRKLRTFPHRTLLQEIYHRVFKGLRWINILDFVEYDKAKAVEVLQREMGWENYGGKHHESIYTRFFQAHILPAKFGYDKRRAHLSSLIVSGQIPRDRALEEMHLPLYEPSKLKEDTEYVLSKFGLTQAEFDAIMKLPHRHFRDYPSYENSFYFGLYDKARALWRRFVPSIADKSKGET